MNYTAVQNQLLDLPQLTFQRFGPIYAGLVSAMSAALARSTNCIDQVAANINPNLARWGYLDAIGALYGIPRYQYETDPAYRTRLIGTLSAPHGTPLAISSFIKLALGLNTTVTEDFATTSYQINFQTPQPQSVLQKVVTTILWVRPAGVPFLPLYQLTGGLFLDTLNYFGVKKVTGSYLSNPNTVVNVNIGANTNSPASTLPTVYLSDPYITGQAQVNFLL
jgi:hypothetical protein